MNLSEELRMYEALAKSKEYIAQLIRKAVFAFQRDTAKVEAGSLNPGDKQRVLDGLHNALKHTMQRVVAQPNVCECHAPLVSAAEFEVGASHESRKPSPGPWKVSDIVKSFGEYLALYILNDRNGNPVSGVYVLAGMGCTDLELANVALVMAAPMILLEAVLCMEALEPSKGIFSVSEATYYVNQVEYVKARLQAMIAAATPLHRNADKPEGGAA